MATRSVTPRSNNEGGIGTTLLRWATGFIKILTVDNITSSDLTASRSVVTDANKKLISGSNTDTELANAVSSKHTQGSDTALGTLSTQNPPVDADLFIYRASASAWALVTSTGTQVKAFLKTYFDTLYAILTAAIVAGGTTGFTLAGGGKTLTVDETGPMSSKAPKESPVFVNAVKSVGQSYSMAPDGVYSIPVGADTYTNYSGIVCITHRKASDHTKCTTSVFSFSGRGTTATFTLLNSTNGAGGAWSMTLSMASQAIIRITDTAHDWSEGELGFIGTVFTL